MFGETQKGDDSRKELVRSVDLCDEVSHGREDIYFDRETATETSTKERQQQTDQLGTLTAVPHKLTQSEVEAFLQSYVNNACQYFTFIYSNVFHLTVILHFIK